MFRPAVRAKAPDGREWEIYTFRLRLPDRRPPRDSRLEYSANAGAEAVGGVLWLLGVGVSLLRRLLVDLPPAAVRALRSDEWTVEAISWAPYRRSYTWTTTREYRGQVLAQVEGGLVRGDTPRPRNAVYLGAQG